jgi:hypothetical protein
LIRFAAQTRSACKAIFAAIAASIFRLVFVVIIRSVYHDRTALFQLRPWSHFQGPAQQNQLDLALQELGRIERTLFMLDWLESPQLWQLCYAGLNKSEQHDALAQVICTFKQGRIADRGPDAQQFRASGLNPVIAAIVYWSATIWPTSSLTCTAAAR